MKPRRVTATVPTVKNDVRITHPMFNTHVHFVWSVNPILSHNGKCKMTHTDKPSPAANRALAASKNMATTKADAITSIVSCKSFGAKV